MLLFGIKITQMGKKMGKDTKTEERILTAAEHIFQEKGFEGARMQEIADHANINKGLLHYYFRTKNKLFETIFSKSLSKMIIRIEDIMKTEQPFLNKLDEFIDNYMDLLLHNPYLPKFVISELNRDPDRFIKSVLSKHAMSSRLNAFIEGVNAAVENGEIRPVDPRQLLIHIIALCIFPFIGRPMLQALLELSTDAFKSIVLERKTVIKEFVRNSISNQK